MSEEEEGGGVIIVGTEEARQQLINDLGELAEKYTIIVEEED